MIDCDDLVKGTKNLECIARDTLRWGPENKAEFEISKTEVLLFSRRREVLNAARNVTVNIVDQRFAIKQGATKWLGFWLDSKLSSKTHSETRLASATEALQRISGLSKSKDSSPMRLMRRIAVGAVTSVALYGAEIWGRGQQDRV